MSGATRIGYDAGVLILLAGCEHLSPWAPDGDDPTLVERIAVSPGTLDFGSVAVDSGVDHALELTVFNLGDAPVAVTGQNEPIGDKRFVVDALPVETVQPGEARVFSVSFAPITDEDAFARLRFDPGSEVVELVGSGLAPVLQLGTADLPATVVGCTGAGTVPVHNAGHVPLVVDPSLEGSEFALTGWPAEIGPGEDGTIDVQFTPSVGGDRPAVLTVESNDPLAPSLEVPLEGLGYEGERVNEQFVYAPTRPTDVVFAVEGGVAAGDPRLADALDAYVGQLTATWANIHATALSSDAPCPSGVPAWAETGDTELRMELVLERAFSGSPGAWDDDLLGLVGSGLFQAEAGGCLDGFRRADADLDLVVVTDGDSTADPEAEADGLRAALAQGASLRVNALTPLSGECGAPAPGYTDTAEATGGESGDLCGASWSAAFTAFASLPATQADVRYPLEELPVQSTLSVTVDGAPFAGWTLDSETNELVIPAESGLTLGSDVEITFVSAVSCG